MIDPKHNLPPGTMLSDVSGKDDLPADHWERREDIMADQAQAQAEDDLHWRRWFAEHEIGVKP